MISRLSWPALLLPAITFAAAPPADWSFPTRFVEQGQSYTVRLPGLAATFDRDGVEWQRGAERLRLQFLDNGARGPVGIDPEGWIHDLRGSNPSTWNTGRPAWRAVVFPEIRPHIALEYRVTGKRLKGEWHLGPGSDPAALRWRYQGAQSVHVDGDGTLVIRTSSGEFREDRPVAIQGDLEVPAQWTVHTDGTVGFTLGPYQPDMPLTVDPSITFSTALGGTTTDVATGVAVDSSGNVYVTGYTDSRDFPMSGGRQLSFGGSVDAFVLKFTSTGTLVWATYLGGSGDDRATGIAVDSNGAPIVVGSTSSTNFPLSYAMQTSYKGSRDGFVSKLLPAGNGFTFSTYLGGAGADSANGVAVDPSGNIYVGGDTKSTNLPVKSAFQAVLGGRQDGFVVKLNASGAQQYGTYIGGTGDDRVLAIAVDLNGSAYVTGVTDSTNFPTLGPIQAYLGGGQDAFVSKLSPAGNILLYSTYLGGNGGTTGYPESGNAIAVDSSGNAYIAGVTSSTDFPTKLAFQPSISVGYLDAFVAKVAPGGGSLVFSTYLGGVGQDIGKGIAIDSAGGVYVTGSTSSVNFPVLNAIQATLVGTTNVFVSQFSSTGNLLVFSSYLGGNSMDSGNAIAVDASGGIILAGQTQSVNFPSVNPYQLFAGADINGFLAKIGGTGTGGGAQPTISTVSPASGFGTSQAFSFTFTQGTGTVQDLAWVEMLFSPSTSPTGGCFVHYDRASQGLYLLLEAGSAARGPQRAATAGTVENRQCAVDLGASSVTVAGDTVTLNLAVRFKPVFLGSVNIYTQSQTNSGLLTSWQSKGTWN